MSNEIYYMTKADGGSGVYELKKATGGWEVYMMKRPDAPDVWTLIGTYSWPASAASTTWNESPGSYGADTIVLTGKTSVRIVGVSGYYNDDVPGGVTFLGSLGFKSSIDFGVCGPGGSLESNYTTFTTQGQAEAAWAGASVEIAIGSDGVISYGMEDSLPTNNAGALTFKVYAK